MKVKELIQTLLRYPPDLNIELAFSDNDTDEEFQIEWIETKNKIGETQPTVMVIIR